MKTFKKIGLGLPFIALLLTLLFGLHHASALTPPKPFTLDTNGLFSQSKFVYNNNQITTTITDTTGSNQTSYDLTFTQNSSNKLEYDSTQQYFCASNVEVAAAPAKIKLSAAPSGSSFKGTLTAYTLSGGSPCHTFTNNPITITNQDTSTGGTAGLPKTLSYNGNTYTEIGSSPLYGLDSKLSNSCYGGSVIYTTGGATNGTAFVDLQYNTTGGATSLTPSLNSLGASQSVINLIDGCVFNNSSDNTAGYSGSITNGKLNAPTPTDDTSKTTPPPPTCESNFSFGLEWIICPALNLADDTATFFSGFVEDQLCFNTGTTSSTSGGYVCNTSDGSNNNLNDGVKAAWTTFKNIASALLVIVLLVAIIAQAAGGGPVDAYTIRKMLPKIVIAVIAIQISWYLFKWAIDLSNDIGHGITALMMTPFGGQNNLTLDKIAGVGFSKHSVGVNDGLGFFTVVAVGTTLGIGLVSLPALGLLALYVILALMTAFFVLVFRKLLIIMLVILGPVALVCWILPGTEKYWKM